MTHGDNMENKTGQRKITGVRTLIYLVIGFAVSMAVYYLCIRAYFEYIIPIYIGITAVLAVLFVLVNGGIRPIIKNEIKKEETVHKRYLADKLRSEKFRKTKKLEKAKYSLKEQEEPEEEPRPNPLGLDDTRREYYSKLILIAAVSLLLVLFVDYFLILFRIDIFGV